MNAPSARNLKPYEFIIVKNRKMLEEIALVKKNAYMIKDSNIGIVIIGKEESEFWQLDIGALIQNMLLEATSLGIGSCWIGINSEQEKFLKNKLNIPDELHPISIVSLGYFAEQIENNNNFYKEKIHNEIY